MTTPSYPWESEPDSDSFESSGLVCLLRRDHVGVWNGYVGVTKTHPLYGKHRNEMIDVPSSLADRKVDSQRITRADLGDALLPSAIKTGSTVALSTLIDVHGGLWSVGLVGSDYPGLWFFSFMCGHAWDFKPLDPLTQRGYETMDPETAEALYKTPADYRTISYARNEATLLANQIAALADAKVATT